jgi:lambda family phage portal protein
MKLFDRLKKLFSRKPTVSTYALSGSNMGFDSFGSGGKSAGGMSRPASIMIHDHFSLRQRVREAMYDSVDARGLVESITDVVADTGLKLKPTPQADILGIPESKAEEWAEAVAGSFHQWAKSKKSHRSRVNNFYQNQRLYEFFQQRDNDIFVRFYYSRDKDVFNPLQIDFIDPNQIRGYDYTTSYIQTPTNSDGIIKDGAGRESAYKVWINNNGQFEDLTIPAIGEKSGRVFMLHGFMPEYAGQTRGYPRLSHAVQEFEQLTDFKASTIQKAINQASMVAAVENDQMDASNPLEGRVAGPVREYGSYPSPAADAGNVTPESVEPIVDWSIMPEATMNAPGSMLIGNLRRGDKLKFLQDTSPSSSYDAFVSAFFSSICASTGWSREVVLKQFNANYSASRATLILCWREALRWREEMAADFLDPVYESWLSEEIAAGRISAPGWSDPRLRAAWLCCEWAGSPMPNIDPQKSAAADRLYVELGAQTLDDVARNFNGSSGKANRAKLSRQYQEWETPPWTPAPVVSEPAPEPEEEEETAEDKNTKALNTQLEQLTFKFYDMKNQVARLAEKPAPAPQTITMPAPEVTIPVDIKIHMERDAEKVETQKNIKIIHDEKGRPIGASIEDAK